MSKPGRNDPCPCGSGKKYKQCCMKKEQEQPRKTYTASGKRKFKAKALGSGTLPGAHNVFQATSAPLTERKIKPLEPMRFKGGGKDFRVKSGESTEEEPTRYKRPEPTKEPEKTEIPKEKPKAPESFEPTKEDFTKKDEE